MFAEFGSFSDFYRVISTSMKKEDDLRKAIKRAYDDGGAQCDKAFIYGLEDQLAKNKAEVDSIISSIRGITLHTDLCKEVEDESDEQDDEDDEEDEELNILTNQKKEKMIQKEEIDAIISEDDDDHIEKRRRPRLPRKCKSEACNEKVSDSSEYCTKCLKKIPRTCKTTHCDGNAMKSFDYCRKCASSLPKLCKTKGCNLPAMIGIVYCKKCAVKYYNN